MDENMKWLNEEFISKILNIDKNNIIFMTINKGVPKGEHFFSKLNRVYIKWLLKKSSTKNEKLNTKEISLIIKTYPDGIMLEFMKNSKAMVREIMMYKYIIPKLNEICEKELAPKYYNNINNDDDDDDDIVIMEDLNFNGFHMEDRIEQLDYNSCKKIIEILAKFHASSIILYKRDPKIINEIGKEFLYVNDNDYMKSFIINCFHVLSNEIKDWPEISSDYSNKLIKSCDKIWKNIIEIIKPKNNELCVLNHGDLWTNNILILYKNNQDDDDDKKNDNKIIEDIKFIDFQFSRWTNPAFDLNSFFIRGVRNLNDIPNLIDSYVSSFNECLKRFPEINLHITKEQIEREVRKFSCYGLISVVCLLPTVLKSRDNPIDYKNITKENYDKNFQTENPYVKACKDPNYRKILPQLLDYYNKEGIL